jgi:carboxylesterase type B
LQAICGRPYGNRCPAPASGNGPQSLTEDCLFLNVQRPATTQSGGRLPVYVWIHGGGLATGSSNQHDATKFVRETGIIVVTINYRLGVLRFLAHPALTAAQGESGNYGFMDQQQALRWVHRNITAFGGDPHRVTIGGESAGGWSVCGHLSAPGSRGCSPGP